MRVYMPIIELFLNNDTQSSFSSKFGAVQSGTEKNDLKKKGKIGELQNPFLLCCVDACGTERTCVLGTKLSQQKMYYIFRIIGDNPQQEQLI